MTSNEKVIVLDTETTNDLDCPIVYDLGFAVVDLAGNVYETHSYVVADIFLDKDLMQSAFFADKIPQYWDDIKQGKRIMRKWLTIRSILREVCAQYGITKIFAHNAIFDWRSCQTTQRYLTCSKYRYFFPYGVELWDTLRMARAVLGADDDYKAFCYENEYLTKRMQARYTAEIIYRYLVQNDEFEEAHTALEDVLIEKEIMRHCMTANPDIDGRLWRD